jgi:hypothetical protein
MNIEQTIRTLMGLPPRHSVLIEGKHGMGKSEVVAQTAAAMSLKLGKPFGLVDIRLGQYEVGDLVGIPRARDRHTVIHKVFKGGSLESQEVVAENVTVHDLPLWFPRDPDSFGYMFFDELNRGGRDTQQWAMQVVLDYKSNFVEVPYGWRVVSACNDDQDVYSILNLDPALYDRFLVIKFEPTIPEWLKHAEKIEVHDAIVKYISKFGSNDLDPPEKMESGKRYPSRRSWVKLSDTIKYMDENGSNPLQDHDYLILLAGGYTGMNVAINFSEFVKKEYRVYSAKEILDNFPKLKPYFEQMIPTDFTFYNKEIVSYVKKNALTKLSKKHGENLLSYIKTVPKEVAAGFWTLFRTECSKASGSWFQDSSEVAGYIRGLLSKEESLK